MRVKEKKKKKKKKFLTSRQQKNLNFSLKIGFIYIQSSYNNTILTIKNENKKVIFVTSTGVYGFKHTKKGTPFAAYTMSLKVFERIKIKKAKIFVCGPGPGKDAVLRVLHDNNIIERIILFDVNKLPHNGCKAPITRRV
nr:ribosomal protein S11 [Hydnora abyssinica]WJM99159.1 ribosomal protein S11 [Hydnora abyssinica]WJM99176.1 ribosomal protein S11 [Hydnora abyssinica]WJM99193.1 ribosomal protein S11 [Hydnora abyssinica]WJM99210.1 ribosomal protein S11 [Hydnora abyssinica]